MVVITTKRDCMSVCACVSSNTYYSNPSMEDEELIDSCREHDVCEKRRMTEGFETFNSQ